MQIPHVVKRRSKRQPCLRVASMFGVTMTTVTLLVGVLHLSLSSWTVREMALLENESGPIIRDQLQRPPIPDDPDSDHEPRRLPDDNGDNSDIDTYTDDVIERHRTYTRLCADGWNATLGSRMSSLVFTDNDFKLAYCFVAKIGCTFWLRIFSFLTRRDDMSKLGIDSPFNIDRTALHSGKLLSKLRFQFPDARLTSGEEGAVKFLFARNPYERLWSVYLDKYYLPDYWLFKPLGRDLCGVNTTFTHFLEAAITLADHHVTPVTSACNPCHFQPDVIGKMETFSRDANRLLDAAGHGALLHDYHNNHSTYVKVELESLLVYNFQRLKGIEKATRATAPGGCLTPLALCRRLWRVFQINGHIRDSIPFPRDDSNDSEYHDYYSLESATRIFMKAVREDPMSKEESRRQRQRFLALAYAKISPSTIMGIQNRYRADFEMFSYDTEPPHLEGLVDEREEVVFVI